MRKNSQLLFPEEDRQRVEHGGALGVKKRKSARPLATKRALHLVFRARRSQMHAHAGAIACLLACLTDRYGVTVYEFSNNNNHLHLLVRGKHRRGIQNFLRVFSGQVAQLVTKAAKGRNLLESFWLVPVFSRIVEWGKAFTIARNYVRRNFLEAAGMITYQPRKAKRTSSVERTGPRKRDLKLLPT